MRGMMGLKESFIPKILLKEGPGDLWTLVKSFVNSDTAGRINIIRNLSPEEKSFFNKLVYQFSDRIDPSNTLRNVDELLTATRIAQLADFASELSNGTDFIKNNMDMLGIDFASDYATLNRINSATPGTKDQAAKDAFRTTDPASAKVLDSVKDGIFRNLDDTEVLLAQTKIRELKRTATDPELKRIFGEMEADIAKAQTHVQELNRVANDAELLPTSGFWDDITEEEQMLSDLYTLSDTQIKTKYESIQKRITANPTAPISEQNYGVLLVAKDRGLLTDDEFSMLTTRKKATTWKQKYTFGKEVTDKLLAEGKTGLEEKIKTKINLETRKAGGNNRTSWDPATRSEIEQLEAILANDFQAWLDAKGLVDPKYRNFTKNFPLFNVTTVGGKTFGQLLEYLKRFMPFPNGVDAAQKFRAYKNLGMTVAGFGAVALIFDVFTGVNIILGSIGITLGISDAYLIDYIFEWSKMDNPKALNLAGQEIKVCESKLPWCGTGLSKDDIKIIDSSLNIFMSRQPLISPNSLGGTAALNIYKFEENRYGFFDKDRVNIASAVMYPDYVKAVNTGTLENLSDDKKTSINAQLDAFGIKQYATGKERLIISTPAPPAPVPAGSGSITTNDAMLTLMKDLYKTQMGNLTVTKIEFKGYAQDASGKEDKNLEVYSVTTSDNKTEPETYNVTTKKLQ